MGSTSKLFEPTPPYEETAPQGATRPYAEVPPTDQYDVEMHLLSAYEHQGDHAAAGAPAPTSSIIPPPHEHCEACERALARRERHAAHRQCCMMVAMVFIVFFVCVMIPTIVVVGKH